VVLSSVERDVYPNNTKQVEDVQDFAMDDEYEKLRMKEATNELAIFIS
jgi:hypothetical protein